MTYADTLTFRHAGDDDIDALARLTAQVQDFHYRATPARMNVVPAEAFIPRIRETLDDPDATYVLACAPSGEPVGCALVRLRRVEGDLLFKPAFVAIVDQMGVAPEAQRRGVGRALMGEVRAFAQAQGVARIGLSVWAHNHGAQALYASLGFAPILHKLELSLDGPPPESDG